jgi:hypothetical protein
MVLQGPRMPQVLERLVLQVQLLAAPVRDGCAPRRGTDTHTHIHGEKVVGWRGSGELKWYYVGQQAGRGGVGFSNETCFRLVREIVTFASGINS